MKRSYLIATVVVVLAIIGAVLWSMGAGGPLPLGHKSVDHTPAAPDMPVGDSCNAMCGAKPIAITCAMGEKPVCDCNATPQVECRKAGAK